MKWWGHACLITYGRHGANVGEQKLSHLEFRHLWQNQQLIPFQVEPSFCGPSHQPPCHSNLRSRVTMVSAWLALLMHMGRNPLGLDQGQCLPGLGAFWAPKHVWNT